MRELLVSGSRSGFESLGVQKAFNVTAAQLGGGGGGGLGFGGYG